MDVTEFSTFLNLLAGFLGILVALLPILLNWSDWRRRFRKLVPRVISQSQVLEAQIGQHVYESRWLDLALVLLGSAFFAMLLSHALLVSGKLSQPEHTFWGTLVVGILVFLAMLAFWYVGKPEFAFGF